MEPGGKTAPLWKHSSDCGPISPTANGPTLRRRPPDGRWPFSQTRTIGAMLAALGIRSMIRDPHDHDANVVGKAAFRARSLRRGDGLHPMNVDTCRLLADIDGGDGHERAQIHDLDRSRL